MANLNNYSKEQIQKVLSLISEDAKKVTEELDKTLQPAGTYGGLVESERYSALSGGKRIRPFLLLETCRMLGGNANDALPFAVALEMIHTYSLIHDDLPCMDNDTERRGKPTNHLVFGEATALLAGDALLTDAFSSVAAAPLPSEYLIAAVSVLSKAAGTHGMVGGQYMDLHFTAENTLEYLLQMQSKKTGALIRAAVEMGIIAARKNTNCPEVRNLLLFADKIGLAFQIKDDILDGDRQECNSYLHFCSEDEAANAVEALTRQAIDILDVYEHSDCLRSFAAYLALRTK